MTVPLATRNPTRTAESSGLLRLVLRLDAIASGTIGAAMVMLGRTLDDLLGTPVVLTRPIGAVLLAYAVAVWFIAVPARPHVPAVRAVIAINVAWFLASAGYAAANRGDLTALGVAFVLAQALAVLVFADLQYVGLRRSVAGDR